MPAVSFKRYENAGSLGPRNDIEPENTVNLWLRKFGWAPIPTATAPELETKKAFLAALLSTWRAIWSELLTWSVPVGAAILTPNLLVLLSQIKLDSTWGRPVPLS